MLKIGLVGCGTMGTTHSNAYKEMSNVSVTCVLDIRDDKADIIVKAHGAKKCNSYEEFFNEDLDIIDICLPTDLHAEYAIKAMNNGINVFCEKPMARSFEEAEAMVKAAENNNVKLSVGQVLRFFPQYKKAAKIVETNKIGTPKLIRTVRNQALPAWSWNNWYLDYQRSGGPILDLIIHDIDWVIHNFGEIDNVYAQTIRKGYGQDDHVQVLLNLKNGSIFYCEGSWALPAGSPFRMAFEIVGTEGQIEYDNTKEYGNKIQINDPEDGYHETNQTVFQVKQEPYYLELKCFVDAVEKNTDVVVKPQEALESLKIALACIESEEKNNVVFLDEV